MQQVTPFLWFDGQAEEAANFYASVFKDSKVTKIERYPDFIPGWAGKVMTATFTIKGLEFVALNGGPQYKFTPAISFLINCEDQAEVDTYWDKLTKNGGQEMPCSWCTDKYGVAWQIVPAILPKLMSDPDPVKAGRVMQAMMKMKKIIIADLQQAYDAK